MNLETDRLKIQKFCWDDFDAYADLMGDREVMQFSLKGPLTREEARQHFQENILNVYDKHPWGIWAVFLKETQQLVGGIGLIPQVVDRIQEVEFAFRIFPKYWGKSLAFEAASRLVDYSFGELQIPRLISTIDPQNYRSQKLSRRLGFCREKQTYFKGFVVDIYARSDSQRVFPH